MTGRALTGALLALSLVLTPAVLPARADQTDPHLDGLFDRLQHTASAGEAEAILQQIWTLWIDTDKPERIKLMAAGMVSMSRSRLQDALVAFTTLIEAAPDYAEAWNKRATVRFLMGDFNGSLEDIEHTLKLEPRHFGALAGLGVILTEIEQYEGAIKAYERLLKVNPFAPGAREQIELLHYKAKDKET